MQNAISWFEIPATDLDRATKFYEAIFAVKLNPLDLDNIKMRMFPVDKPCGGSCWGRSCRQWWFS